MSLFEKAARRKLRFESVRGLLTVENLWDLPLTARNELSLDGVGRIVQRALKSDSEESLVAPSKTPGHSDNVLRLDILKHIIKVRQEENAAQLAVNMENARREKLKEILARKQDDALEQMSEEDIKKELGITE